MLNEDDEPQKWYSTRNKWPLGERKKNQILSQHHMECANITCHDDSLKLCEAIQCKDASRRRPCKKNMTLMTNVIQEFVSILPNCKSVRYKWVFCTKHDAMCQITKHNARLVAKKCLICVEGIDFYKTFIFIATFTTIWCIIALKGTKDLESHQIDMKTKFINRKLDDNILIDQIDEFVQEGKEHLMYKLKNYCMG